MRLAGAGPTAALAGPSMNEAIAASIRMATMVFQKTLTNDRMKGPR